MDWNLNASPWLPIEDVPIKWQPSPPDCSSQCHHNVLPAIRNGIRDTSKLYSNRICKVKQIKLTLIGKLLSGLKCNFSTLWWQSSHSRLGGLFVHKSQCVSYIFNIRLPRLVTLQVLTGHAQPAVTRLDSLALKLEVQIELCWG